MTEYGAIGMEIRLERLFFNLAVYNNSLLPKKTLNADVDGIRKKGSPQKGDICIRLILIFIYEGMNGIGKLRA